MVEIGPEKRGYNAFMNKPIHIKKEMLSPTEYRRTSIVLNSWNLRITRRRVPGMNVR
jgi:hypothetical protein